MKHTVIASVVLFLSACDLFDTNLTVDAADSLNVIPEIDASNFTASSGQLTLDPSTLKVTYANDSLAKTASNLVTDINFLLGSSMATAAKVDACGSDSNTICLSSTNPDAINPWQLIQSYTLTIDTDSGISIVGGGQSGVIHGTQTMLQLIAINKADPGSTSNIPTGKITDGPAFKERSVMLDVGRKYFEVSYIKRLIRLMAYYKMNYLHLHFTEWNAFRLNDPDNYKGLAPVDESYSKADIQEIQAYADSYGISVIPEIDIPAHSTQIVNYFKGLSPSINLSFDSDSTCSKMDDFMPQTGQTPGWTIDVTNPDALPKIEALINNFIPWFQKDSDGNDYVYQNQYFHVGGDEWPTNAVMNACGILKTACDNDPDSCKCPNNVSPLVKCLTTESYAPGGLFVNFINQIQEGLFSDPNGPKMRMWTGWNAALKDGSNPNLPPPKYGLSSVDPDPNIVIDAWLIKGVPTSGTLNNTSYQMTYLSPGFSFQPWDYPPPEEYLANQWAPNVYIIKNHPLESNSGAIYSDATTVLGSGLHVWADGTNKNIDGTDYRPDEFYHTLLQRPLMLIANRAWAGNSTATQPDSLCKDANGTQFTGLQNFIGKITAIGEMPYTAADPMQPLTADSIDVPAKTPVPVSSKMSGATDDLPIPWTLAATIVLNDTPTDGDLIYLLTSEIFSTKEGGGYKTDHFSVNLRDKSGQASYTNGLAKTGDDGIGSQQAKCNTVGTHVFNTDNNVFSSKAIPHHIKIVGDIAGVHFYLKLKDEDDYTLQGSGFGNMSLPMLNFGSEDNSVGFTITDLNIQAVADHPKQP